MRLAREGRDAAVVMMGAVLMFLIAGLLEGLGRQLVLDTLSHGSEVEASAQLHG